MTNTLQTLGPKPQPRKPFYLPLWSIILLWGTAGLAGAVWLSSLKDVAGQDVLDDKLIQLLMAFLALIGTLMTQILQKQVSIEHENHPNSGATHRDATDRIERDVKEALRVAAGAERLAIESRRDSRQTREEVQQLHSDLSQMRVETSTDLNRIVDIVTQKG